MFNDLEYEFFSGELDRLIEKTDSTICPLIQANAKGASRLLKKSDFVRSSTLDARTILNPNGNKQESKRLFDAPKNVFQQPARPKPLSKMAAASFACSLMENYSSFPPTLTKGGRYFRVASLMYEAATGEQNADLTRYCSGRL
jgi:hypothetical protein